MLETIISALVNGLSRGGVYAMIALGYTMVYGIAKMLNFAHGDLIMVGAYAILVFLGTGSPLLSVALSIVFCILLGVAIEKVAYKLKHREYRIVGACEILSLFLEIFKHHEQKIRAGVEHSAQTYARIARECFDENVHSEISVDAVADILGVSRTYLYKIFVNAYGISPRAYLSEARILRAKELLSAGKDTISAVAREVGYEDVLEFSKFFSRKTGISPSEYRKMKARDR